MWEATKAFLKALSQKLWFVVTGLIGGILTITSLFQITPSIPWQTGLLIVVVSLIMASYLAYCDLYKTSKTNKSTTTLVKRTRPNIQGLLSLSHIQEHMNRVHGHDDHLGLESDYRDGIPVSDLLSRNCTLCGRPRSQKGADIIE